MEVMRCLKCGAKLQRNYCIKCGSLYQEENVYQISNHWDDTDELELLIGDKSTQFIHQPSNLCAAFFGLPYFFYRKCFLEGILFTLIEFPIVIYILDKLDIQYILLYYVLSFFIHGAIFNPLYLKMAKAKMKRLRKNNVSEKRILLRGGTSTVSVIIYILIVLGFSILYFSFLHYAF